MLRQASRHGWSLFSDPPEWQFWVPCKKSCNSSNITACTNDLRMWWYCQKSHDQVILVNVTNAMASFQVLFQFDNWWGRVGQDWHECTKFSIASPIWILLVLNWKYLAYTLLLPWTSCNFLMLRSGNNNHVWFINLARVANAFFPSWKMKDRCCWITVTMYKTISHFNTNYLNDFVCGTIVIISNLCQKLNVLIEKIGSCHFDVYSWKKDKTQ